MTDDLPNHVTVPGRTLADDILDRALERMRTRAHYEWQAELAHQNDEEEEDL